MAGPTKTIYKFASLKDVAEWFREKGTKARNIKLTAKRDIRYAEGLAEGWEGAADILDNLEIEHETETVK